MQFVYEDNFMRFLIVFFAAVLFRTLIANAENPAELPSEKIHSVTFKIPIDEKQYFLADCILIEKTDAFDDSYNYESVIVLRKRSFKTVDEKEFEAEVNISDPIEGFNRVMTSFNYGLVMYVFRPVAIGYATVFPRFMINGFGNLTDNLEFLVRTFSCMLQAKFGDAGEESLRFLINTVLGVAGFFDVADDWFGLKTHDEDFGQAFASWGIGTGCFLMLPLQGPSSGRDCVGLLFDYALDPKTYVYGAQWFAKLNKSSLYIQEYEKISEANEDGYTYVKDIWYLVRKVKIED